jgi:hypothetical protein
VAAAPAGMECRVTSAPAGMECRVTSASASAASLGQIGDYCTHRDRQNGRDRNTKPPPHERLPRPYSGRRNHRNHGTKQTQSQRRSSEHD